VVRCVDLEWNGDINLSPRLTRVCLECDKTKDGKNAADQDISYLSVLDYV